MISLISGIRWNVQNGKCQKHTKVTPESLVSDDLKLTQYHRTPITLNIEKVKVSIKGGDI